MGNIMYRRASDDDFDAIVDFDGAAFGQTYPDAVRDLLRGVLDLDRFVLAFDGDALVAVSGNYSQELTVPGSKQVPAAGVTWIAVAPTHRRQGILTQLMAELHADAREHREPLAMLTASEGGIYGRFGYGVASQRRVVQIDRRHAEVRAEFRPPPGSVKLVNAHNDDVLEQIVALHDRARLQRTGEIQRSTSYFELQRELRKRQARWAVHADGYASWNAKHNWNKGLPAFELELFDLVATTPEAHAALWHTVLSVDLVGPVSAYASFAVDDELPYLLDNPRAVHTEGLIDMMWLNVLDVRAALTARSYGTDDSMVIEVDGRRWQIDGNPQGATVKAARRRADLVVDRRALAAIYLGGFRPSELVRARQIEARSAEVERRADHFFSDRRLPTCSTDF